MLMMEMAVMPLMMVGLVLVVVVVMVMMMMVMMMMVMMKIFSTGGGDAQNQRIPREVKNVQDHDHLMVHEDHTEDDSF